MNRVDFKRCTIFFSILVFTCLLVVTATGYWVQPVQAGFSSKKASTPTPTNTLTPTPTLPPYATPTPGPTTVVGGTWKIVSSPNVGSGTYGNQLKAVAVVSSSNVWAVGFSPSPSGTPLYIRQSLIEHWNGSNWSVISSPNPANQPDVELNGVAAISASDIWAVGTSGNPSYTPYQTLTEHWNGSSWNIISSPSPGTYNGNVLNAVSAVSSNDVWAVGWAQSSPTGNEGLTMHWDGTSWTVVPNPSKYTLNAVTTIASNDVWAAGFQTLLHWNGSTWSSVPFPQPNAAVYLQGLSGTSSSDVWAVGYQQWAYGEGYLDAPISYHWNGTSWSLVPNAGTTYEYFFAVTAIAPNDVWAVGDNGQFQHWDGATWSRVSAPYPDLGSRFSGVAAVSSDDVWAVGDFTQSTTNQLRTLIDRYTIP
jgi:hypothetical protein